MKALQEEDIAGMNHTSGSATDTILAAGPRPAGSRLKKSLVRDYARGSATMEELDLSFGVVARDVREIADSILRGLTRRMLGGTGGATTFKRSKTVFVWTSSRRLPP